MNIQLFTQTMSVMTMIAQAISVVGILLLVGGYVPKIVKKYNLDFNYFVIAAYVVAMFAMVGSLIYSDVAGYNPCKLCWYQRILMYPQTLLYLIALFRKDKGIAIYGLVMSIIGVALATYHYLLQIGVLTTTSCSAVGFSISCSDRFVTNFGYITIPMMALSAFLLISVIWTWFLVGREK